MKSELTQDCISREDAIAYAISGMTREIDGDKWIRVSEVRESIKTMPSARSEYEPVTIEDFAKTMSENTFYGFMAWTCEALDLMERQGFVICKKTM